MSTGVRTSNRGSRIVVARASPAQAGAIGVIQLSGAGAGALLKPFFSTDLPDKAGQFRMGTLSDADGYPVDQVLIACLNDRDEFYEITCHGGLRIIQRIVDTLERAGAELVDGEELLNTSLKLQGPVAQEAYRLLVGAKTPLAVRFLLAQASGKLNEILERGSHEERRRAMRYWPAISFLLEGIRILVLGPPNAGKSTLLNALGRMEHALVADLPGTTRDYVQAQVDLAGLPARITDTAGVGATADPLAREAREKTLAQIGEHDLIFLLLDATNRKTAQDTVEAFRRLERVIVLLNKIDRPDTQCRMTDLVLPASWTGLEISALKATRLDEIPSMVWRTLGLDGFDYREPLVFSDALAKLNAE